VLAAEFRLLYFDLRGHYMSSAPRSPSDYGVDFDADDAQAIQRAMASRPVHVLGHSYGSIVALEMARRHPEAVLGVTACSCPFGLGDADVEARLDADARSQAVSEAEGEEARRSAYLSFYHHRPVDLVTARYARLVEESYAAARNRQMLADREAAARVEPEWEAFLDEVRCPVLFLFGQHDPLVDPGRVRDACEGQPLWKAVEVPDARHEVLSDQPWICRAEIIRFVEECPPAERTETPSTINTGGDRPSIRREEK
jgi:pimeloyl-ACP methyl ester carboxylesterase